jgi:hypothetical protein
MLVAIYIVIAISFYYYPDSIDAAANSANSTIVG